jgi:hypothetical protein
LPLPLQLPLPSLLPLLLLLLSPLPLSRWPHCRIGSIVQLEVLSHQPHCCSSRIATSAALSHHLACRINVSEGMSSVLSVVGSLSQFTFDANLCSFFKLSRAHNIKNRVITPASVALDSNGAFNPCNILSITRLQQLL